MSWTMLTIREIDDGADDVLYPAPTSETNGIALDRADGRCSPPIVATDVHLMEFTDGGKRQTLLKVAEIKASVYITDSRIAIACTKYDKGGGWTGGLGTMVALNAVSKARAAIRRRGKSLVGHVRYPWLSSVGFVEKTGWLSAEQVRLLAVEKTGPEKRTYILDLTLPKSTSAEKVAREVATRAAQYRLDRTKFDSDEVRAKVERLVDPPTLRPEKGQFATWSFPTYFFARTSTAFGDVADVTT